jgi:hypothetical protein
LVASTALVFACASRVSGECNGVFAQGYPPDGNGAVVIIPNTTLPIPDVAFAGCTSLVSVVIGNSVTSIGSFAFSSCSSLVSAVLPNSITALVSNVFDRCTSLASVSLPDSLLTIGTYTFFQSTSLRSIFIPDSVVTIGDEAFYGSGLTSINLPDSVTSMGGGGSLFGAFEHCTSMLSVSIPDSITAITNYTFRGCSSLASLVLPNSSTSVGTSAFNGCSSLSTIAIPNSVTVVGLDAFTGCPCSPTQTTYVSGATLCNCALGSCSPTIAPTAPTSGPTLAPTATPSARTTAAPTAALVLTPTDTLGSAPTPPPVLGLPQLRIRPLSLEHTVPPGYMNSSDSESLNRTRWAIGDTYRITPVNVNASSGGYSDASPMDGLPLTFRLQWHGGRPAGMRDSLVGGTGEVELRFEGLPLIGPFSVSLLVSATGTLPLTIYTITFNEFLPSDTSNTSNGPGGYDCYLGSSQRVDRDEFDNRYTCNCNTAPFNGNYGTNCDIAPQLYADSWEQYVPVGQVRSRCIFAVERTQWALNQTYHLAPVHLTEPVPICDPLRVNDSHLWNGGTGRGTVYYCHDHVTYIDAHAVSYKFALIWYGDVSRRPSGFSVPDPATGEMTVQIPSVAGMHHAALQVECTNCTRDTLPYTLYNITFEFRAADTASPSNGPGGEDCDRETQRVDEDEFDDNYSCACLLDSSTEGPNCRLVVAAPAASGGGGSNGTAIYSAVAAVVVLLVCVFASIRFQAHRANKRPADMTSMQQDLLEMLGTSGAALNIKSDEFGLTLMFGSSMVYQQLCSQVDSNAADHWAAELLKCLRRLSGVPRRLTALLKRDDTHLTFEPGVNAVLLHIKRSPDIDSGVQDNFAAALQARVDRRHIYADYQDVRVFVQEVSVVLPTRVPRELNRHSLERLEMIGKGNNACHLMNMCAQSLVFVSCELTCYLS